MIWTNGRQLVVEPFAMILETLVMIVLPKVEGVPNFS
jgi:hypothetical protein